MEIEIKGPKSLYIAHPYGDAWCKCGSSMLVAIATNIILSF